MTPLVSIIIPAFNRAGYLPETLESALCQSVTDIECIVVDDGSTDDTANVVDRFLRRDPRVKYLSQHNSGPSAARNHGLSQSRGQFIQFLDSDDIILPDKLALQLKQLESANVLALSYCDYRYCAHDNVNETASRDSLPPPRFIMEKPLWDIASRWESELSIPMHCFLFDARFFREHGIRFDENLPNHEDWDCWMQIFALDPLIFHVPEVMAIYRLHNDSICVDSRALAAGFEKAIRKQQLVFRHDRTLRRILKRKIYEYNGTNQHTTIMLLNDRVTGYVRMVFRRFTPWPIQQLFRKYTKSGSHKDNSL